MASNPDHEPNLYAMTPLGHEGPTIRGQIPPPPQVFRLPVSANLSRPLPMTRPQAAQSFMASRQEPESRTVTSQHKDQTQLASPSLALNLVSFSAESSHARPNSASMNYILHTKGAETISAPFMDSYAQPQLTDITQPHTAKSFALPQTPHLPWPQPAPQSAHQKTESRLQSQQESACIPCVGDNDELDEVMFEGRIFHYLKPFEILPRGRPKFLAYQLKTPSFDLRSQMSGVRVESSSVNQTYQTGQQKQTSHTYPHLGVPTSPVYSPLPLAATRKTDNQELLPPPPLESPDLIPLQTSDTGSRLTSMSKIKILEPGDLPASFPSAIPGPMGFSVENAIISDDDHSDEEEAFYNSQPSSDNFTKYVNNEVTVDESIPDTLIKEYTMEEGCISKDDVESNVLAQKAMNEMETFFATLDASFYKEEDVENYLGDDIGLGYLLEKVQ